MNTNLFMNCMWVADTTPEKMAETLGLSAERFYEKAFGEASFTANEKYIIQRFLRLSDGEMKRVFGEDV